MTTQNDYKKQIEAEIEVMGAENRLEEAMKYSLQAGGKRVRPILFLVAMEMIGREKIDQEMRGIGNKIATAIEMIHTYSLVQDDLPIMDDDDLRRGKKTSHIIYGDAGAMLASDGLLTEAVKIMMENALNAGEGGLRGRILRASEEILQAVDSRGMLWGQWLDLSASGKIDKYEIAKLAKEEKIELLKEIHRCKTGKLIESSLVAGAIFGGGDKEEIEAIAEFGKNLGLCFQITDDILDETSTAEELGKTPGKDLEQGKLTYPSLFGTTESQALAKEVAEKAETELMIFGERTELLKEMTQKILRRAE